MYTESCFFNFVPWLGHLWLSLNFSAFPLLHFYHQSWGICYLYFKPGFFDFIICKNLCSGFETYGVFVIKSAAKTKLQESNCSLDISRKFFSQMVVRSWNGLHSLCPIHQGVQRWVWGPDQPAWLHGSPASDRGWGEFQAPLDLFCNSKYSKENFRFSIMLVFKWCDLESNVSFVQRKS